VGTYYYKRGPDIYKTGVNAGGHFLGQGTKLAKQAPKAAAATGEKIQRKCPPNMIAFRGPPAEGGKIQCKRPGLAYRRELQDCDKIPPTTGYEDKVANCKRTALARERRDLAAAAAGEAAGVDLSGAAPDPLAPDRPAVARESKTPHQQRLEKVSDMVWKKLIDG